MKRRLHVHDKPPRHRPHSPRPAPCRQSGLDGSGETRRPVILVYIRETDDPDAGALGAAQRWWLHHSLIRHMQACESRGNRVILRTGSQNDIVEKLVVETGAKTIFWNRRYHLKGRETDAA